MTTCDAPAATSVHADNKNQLISTQTRFIWFQHLFIDDIDHGGHRSSMIGHPSHLRNEMNHHIHFERVLDNSQELILGVGDHVLRKNMGMYGMSLPRINL